VLTIQKLLTSNQLIKLLFISIILLSLNSCVTLPGYENARITPMGERAWLIGTSYQSVEIQRDSMANKTIVTPLFVVARRKGLTERIDYGTYFSSGAGVYGDLKARLVGSNLSSFSLATGLGLGSTGFIGPNASYQSIIPVYTSWHLSDRFSLYFSPQASITWSNREKRFLKSWILNGGLEIGNRRKFVINISYSDNFGIDAGVGKAMDFGIAYKFPGRQKTLFLPTR